jgi:DNA-binding NtrC family response regulator
MVVENSGKVHVLVVDDDKAIRDVLKIFLGLEGGLLYSSVETVDQAIDFVEHNNPDVVVTDYNLSDMNGIELFRHVNGEMGKKIPFIIITGDDKKDIGLTPVNGINVYFLQKGIGNFFEELISLIERAALGADS